MYPIQISISAILFAGMFFLPTAAVFSSEIEGKVVEVEDKIVRVSIDSKTLPTPGDQVQIYFLIPGLDDPVNVALGIVKEIDGDTVLVQIESATGKIAKLQLVRITSEKPRKKGASPSPRMKVGDPPQQKPKRKSSGSGPTGLDREFGQNGMAITSIGSGADEAMSVVLQPDGKIIAAGRSEKGPGLGGYSAVLVRYHDDGKIDESFGKGGITTQPLARFDSTAKSVALQSDGRIVIAGWAEQRGYGYDFGVARFNADGTLDSSFGNQGIAITNMGSGNNESAHAMAVTVQPDGKILAAGNANVGGRFRFSVARYLPHGTLDDTFNNRGRFLADFPMGNAFAMTIGILPDNGILAVGGAQVEGRSHIVLIRLREDGEPDRTFGENGKVLSSIGDKDASANSYAILPDGGILVSGYAQVQGRMCVSVASYGNDGTPETHFGTNGNVIIPLGDKDANAVSIAIGSDSRIFVAANAVLAGRNRMALLSLRNDGSLDSQFGNKGTIFLDIDSESDVAATLQVQMNGGLVLAGSTQRNGKKDLIVIRCVDRQPRE
jgi:uncharacterized delta-60 repeat protein